MSRVPAVLSELSCRVFTVPTDRPEADGTFAWSSTTLVVVEAAAAGQRGTGWSYAAPACGRLVQGELAEVVRGDDAFDIVGHHEAMVRTCRNFGRPGLVSCAISAVDLALWDLKARLLGVPLAQLFGRFRHEVPLYGSGGFTTYDEDETVAQLMQFVDEWGMARVKIKIGESWGSAVSRDLARVALSRRTIGEEVELFVDANGAYNRKLAARVGHQLAEEYQVVWFEEPVSSDDLTGLHGLRAELALDVAAGEYGYDEPYFARMIAADAVDCMQVDVTRCGGYTAWLRTAALAGAAGLQVSGHCAPNLHAPVGAAVPNLRHIEYFHDHARTDALLFDGVGVPKGGMLSAGDGVGHGMTLRAVDAEAYRVR